MQLDEIKALIETGLPGSQAQLDGDGYHFQVVVTWDRCSGMSPVKRQQQVYGCLQANIASGALHAISMKTYTPDEQQRA